MWLQQHILKLQRKSRNLGTLTKIPYGEFFNQQYQVFISHLISGPLQINLFYLELLHILWIIFKKSMSRPLLPFVRWKVIVEMTNLRFFFLFFKTTAFFISSE